MRSYYKIFSLLIVLSGLTGCAFTATQVPLNYSPQNFGIHASAKNTLAVGDIKDARGAEDSKLLMYKVNMYGMTTSGKFVADQPINNILQAALSESLKNAGYKVLSHNANMMLAGQLLNLDMTPVMGILSGSLKCKMQVNFKLINNKTGNEVWSDVFVGNSDIKNVQLIDGANVRAAFAKAADNLIQQLETSSEFRRALNR